MECITVEGSMQIFIEKVIWKDLVVLEIHEDSFIRTKTSCFKPSGFEKKLKGESKFLFEKAIPIQKSRLQTSLKRDLKLHLL